MSLYTFATENFTTADDRHRRPAINRSQIVRTLAFIVVAFMALVCMARHGHVVVSDQPAQDVATKDQAAT